MAPTGDNLLKPDECDFLRIHKHLILYLKKRLEREFISLERLPVKDTKSPSEKVDNRYP
jgi:hypothetical protein